MSSVQNDNNQYILGYVFSIFDRTHPSSSNKFELGDTLQLGLYINIPYDASPPSAVSFYMKLENTGQVIFIDTVTKSMGLTYWPVRSFQIAPGQEINPSTLLFQYNPNVTLVSVFTTFELEPVMKDINGNPAYVWGPVSFYEVVQTPYGTFTTKPVTGFYVTVNTQIANVKVSYSSYAEESGETIHTFTITGQLQAVLTNNVTLPLADQVVYAYVCPGYSGCPEQLVTEGLWPYTFSNSATTDKDGNFTITITVTYPPHAVPDAINHILVVYKGSTYLRPSSYETVVVFPSPTSYQPPTPQVRTTTPQPAPQQSTTTTTPTAKPKLSAGDLAILLGGAGLLTGITAYGLSKKGKV